MLSTVSLLCCSRDADRKSTSDAAPARPAAPSSAVPEPMPALLYLPDGGDIAPPQAPGQELLPGPWGMPSMPTAPSGRCPAEMVDVRGAFCIDRYEVVLVDSTSGRELSPYYAPSRQKAKAQHDYWQHARSGCATDEGRRMDVPPIESWQLEQDYEPKATARGGVVPAGYLSGDVAERACRNAGKRLCRPEEWVMACRGDRGRKFPYGAEYEEGRCNVYREAHPAAILHANASINHLDPRLNLVSVHGKPLLRQTGATPECKSQWGADAIFDMVGNLDEWVDDPEGTFQGGFYSRNTREGCDARVTTHPREYYDYSLGVRCCR